MFIVKATSCPRLCRESTSVRGNNEPDGGKGHYDRGHWLRHVDGRRRSHPRLEQSQAPQCLPPQHPMGLSGRGDHTLLGQRGSARRTRVRDGVYRIPPIEDVAAFETLILDTART